MIGGRVGRREGELAPLGQPFGLRFTAEGTGLVVVDGGSGRLSLFSVADGACVRHLATGLRVPMDVEACGSGWWVACRGSNTVEMVGGDGGDAGQVSLGKWGSGDGELRGPSALALVPGLGLVVREDNGGRLQVFAAPADIAMAAMSAHRVAWMVGVARAIALRVAGQGLGGGGSGAAPQKRR